MFFIQLYINKCVFLAIIMKELGFQPYWQIGDIPIIVDKRSNIITSEECMICLEKKPDVLFDCGHKVTCTDCYLKCIQTKSECIICRAKVKYFFVY
jgi:hypothetical protein